MTGPAYFLSWSSGPGRYAPVFAEASFLDERGDWTLIEIRQLRKTETFGDRRRELLEAILEHAFGPSIDHDLADEPELAHLHRIELAALEKVRARGIPGELF